MAILALKNPAGLLPRVGEPALSKSKGLRPRHHFFSFPPFFKKLLKALLTPFILLHLSLQLCFALNGEEIARFQVFLMDKPVGERIAFWAEKFVGTSYDMDPLGEYVSKGTIVADERVDCMYLTFRAVELALSNTPEQAIQIALEKRFRSRGILKGEKVMNYDDRFEYGEDMIDSGKWGKDITGKVGKTVRIKGSRGKLFVYILSPDTLLRGVGKLKSGDIIFFVKEPERRKVGEVVGHIGIIKIEKSRRNPKDREVYIIHASGTKEKGGDVKKVLLKQHVSKMAFIGVKITRFH